MSKKRSGKKKKSRSKTIASRALKLLKEFEEELESGVTDEWESVASRFQSIVQRVQNTRRTGLQSDGSKSAAQEDYGSEAELELEQQYKTLQKALIDVRTAAATAIATQKQLEQQLQNNRDQSQTWLDRATLALKQGSQDLANQASKRHTQYLAAVDHIQAQLPAQIESTNQLRQQLADLEVMVQKAYTTKQILRARAKSANAVLVANECLKNFKKEGFDSALEQVDASVVELENKAKNAQSQFDGVEHVSSPSLTELSVNVQLLLETVSSLAKQLASLSSETS